MATTTSTTGSFPALVFPPDLRSTANYPAICYEIVKFRDRNYVVDTVTDESGRVTTTTPTDNSFENGSIGEDIVRMGIDAVKWGTDFLDNHTPWGEPTGGTPETSIPDADEAFETITEPLTYSPTSAAQGEVQRLGAIYLPLPQAVNNQYDIGWRMSEVPVIEAMRSAFNAGNWRDGLMNLTVGAYALIAGGIEKNIGNAAPNPRKQAIFDSIDPRNFQFTHIFTPKSKEEAAAIDAIIQQLAFHALPEGSRTDALWQFPDEFRISFINTKGFPVIGYCVCENVSIDYNSQGGQSIHTDGYPTQMAISLRFKETDLRRKSSVGMQGMKF